MLNVCYVLFALCSRMSVDYYIILYALSPSFVTDDDVDNSFVTHDDDDDRVLLIITN